jgi:hypothetical protein
MSIPSHMCNVLDCDTLWSHSIGIHFCNRCAQPFSRMLKQDPLITELRANVVCKMTDCEKTALHMFHVDLCRFHIKQICSRCNADSYVWCKPKQSPEWRPLSCSSPMVPSWVAKIFEIKRSQNDKSQ